MKRLQTVKVVFLALIILTLNNCAYRSTSSNATVSPLGQQQGQSLADYNASIRKQLVKGCLASNISISNPSFNLNEIQFHQSFDKIKIADSVRIQDEFESLHAKPGVGVPVVIRVRHSQHDNQFPDTGLWLPMTVVRKRIANQSKLVFLDPFSADRKGSIHGKPLATNHTAALALNRRDRRLQFNRHAALVNYGSGENKMSVDRLSAFDPTKQPVVFVHGFLSTPATWAHPLNELMSDPKIANRYEFWTFTYPSGAPVPFLANSLRQELRDMLNFRHSNGASQQSVTLIGQSMGGLLSKIVTQKSGQTQWQQYFRKSPENLPLQQTQAKLLRNLFFYQPLPEVDTVIFAGTPHRGVDTKQIFGSKLIKKIASGPDSLNDAVARLITESPECLTPLGQTVLADGFPASIEYLDNQSPVAIGSKTFNAPLNPKVSYHSIIASKEGLHVDKSTMTDGVVSYNSAHLKGVTSETIIDGDHDLHKTEVVIDRIIKILSR